MDKKIAMQDIIAQVGREKAIDMVMKAYDTELMTTLLNRLVGRSFGLFHGLHLYRRLSPTDG